MNIDYARSLAMTALRPMCEDKRTRDVVLNVLECIANSYDDGTKLLRKTDEEDLSPESFLVQELRHFHGELTPKE